MAAVATAVVFAACAKPAPPPIAPPPPPPARIPLVLDAVGPDDAFLHVDGAALRGVVLPELLDAAGRQRADIQVALADAQSKCGFAPLLAVDELLAFVKWAPDGAAKGGAVLRLNQPPENVERCLRLLAPEAQPTQLLGRPSWVIRGAFVAFEAGLVVAARSTDEAAEILRRFERPLPGVEGTRAALSGAAVVALMGPRNPFGIASMNLRWDARSRGSGLVASVNYTDEKPARVVELLLQESLVQLLGASGSMDASTTDTAGALVRGAAVTRSGSRVDVTVDAPPLSGQNAVVSRVSALAVRGVRKFVAADKIAEARDDVYAIARGLVDYVARQRELKRPARFPPSAPLVPPEIPWGKTVSVSAESFAHPSWQAIALSSEGPVHYAREFVTAPDGRTAVARARGDIDGDGVTSLFELDVRVDPRGVAVIAPLIRERDVDE